jgi:hypothetical protein
LPTSLPRDYLWAVAGLIQESELKRNVANPASRRARMCLR